jgi:VWFA-related protein
MLPALKQDGFLVCCARACFTVLLVVSPAVFAQSSQTQTAANTSELSSHDAPATFRARVNLVMVPVVVRDRQGHAIGTLKQEDFQLFDKGKSQIISKFSVEKADAKVASSAVPVPPPTEDGDRAKPVENIAAAAIPTRFVAYLFDDVHLDFPDLAQARTAAMHYLTASFQPTDRAAIYTTSGQGMLDFTDDLAKIREALDRI